MCRVVFVTPFCEIDPVVIQLGHAVHSALRFQKVRKSLEFFVGLLKVFDDFGADDVLIPIVQG